MDGAQDGIHHLGDDSDGFDQAEFQQWLQDRRARRGRGARDSRRGRRDSSGGSDDRDGRSNSGPAPEWDGETTSFQDYAIKARLWLATTKAKAKTRGPLLLQKLTKVPFESMKFLAKDAAWMASITNGEDLIKMMDQADYFGEDRDEDLLSALARITYHLRRDKGEGHRSFFGKWDVAMRKVVEHRVELPNKFVGFLMINALALSEVDIKNLLNYTRGSIEPQDIREWVRKHETKLQVSQVGTDPRRDKVKTTPNYLVEETYDQEEDEINLMEDAIRELRGEAEGEAAEDDGAEDEVHTLNEQEAAEILATMVHRKRTFLQSVKEKKSKELGRGYKGGKGSGSGPAGRTSAGFMRPGKYNLKGNMTIEEVKKVTRCGNCKRIGHWWKECPFKDGGEKEAHVLTQETTNETDEAYFCGYMLEEQDIPVEPFPDRESSSRLSRQDRESVDETSGSSSLLFEAPSIEGLPVTIIGDDDFKPAPCAYNDRVDDLPPKELYFAEGLMRDVRSVSPESSFPESACATIDTGCQRMAIGMQTLKCLADHLPADLPVGLVPQEHRFRSVHGRSTTSHVASLPTSLGPSGALLRPAVFENPESTHAPFLISLPFLLFCRAVLYLDPTNGLKIHFRKLNFTVPCHIGPTGALRIPLCQFDSRKRHKVREAQREFADRRSEFEVLRVQETSSISQTLEDCQPCDFSSHGPPTSQEDPPAEGHNPSVAPADDEAPDLVGADHPACGGIDQGQPREERGADGHGRGLGLRLGLHSGSQLGQQTAGQSDAQPQQVYGINELAGTSREDGAYVGTRPGYPTTTCQPGSSSTTTSGISKTSSGSGRSTQVPLPEAAASSAVLGPETGSQLPSLVLAMRSSKGEPMRVLPVAQLPATVEGSTVGRPPARQDLRQGAGEDRSSLPPSLPTRDYLEVRHKCLPGDSPLCVLRRSSEAGEDQVGRGGFSTEEGIQQELQQGEESRDDGVRAVHGVEAGQGEAPRDLEGSGDSMIVKPENSESGGTASMSKREKKLQRQALASLQRAETMWQDLMTLVGDSCVYSGDFSVDHLQTSGAKTSTAQQCKKSEKRWTNVLGSGGKRNLVSEVFNPNRFKKESHKQGLNHGKAFDITLGTDLLRSQDRNDVRHYVKTNQPGLVVVSPPCTLYTLLQNLNQRYLDTPEKIREHMKRVAEAQVLMRFAIEICRMVASYQGTFLFEQPQTSRAWKEPFVERLTKELQNSVVTCDQCMFDLRSPEGFLHKKPTTWLTNNEHVASVLRVRCDQGHQHLPVLGAGPGGSRSRLAQEYPEPLVQAILRGYRRSLPREVPKDIKFLKAEDYLKEGREILATVRRTLDLNDTYCFENLAVPVDDEIYAPEAVQPDDDVIADEAVVPEDEVIADAEAPKNDIAEQPEAVPAEEKYQPLPRESAWTVSQLVKRAHNGLGHPGNDRLVRILKDAKASEEAIRCARNLTCPICQKHQAIRPCRSAAPPKELQFNEVIGIDTLWLQGLSPSSRGKMALNIVDWSTRFQMILPLKDHTPQGARQAFSQWTRIFGPPQKVYNDLGKEFRGTFEKFMDEQSVFLDPSSLETPEQRGITERAGRTFKEILAKTLHQVGCDDWTTWEEAVAQVNMTINRLLNRSGYSPAQRVFGYNPRLPGGLLSGGANDSGTASRYQVGDVQVQRSMELRCAAAQAFHQADCNQALRNALHHGPRRQVDFEPGQTVYFWRKGVKRYFKNNVSFWHGPAKVVITNPPSTIWLTYQGHLVKASPEHLRL